MSHPLLISVILNTNRRDDTLACIESLRANDYPNQRIIVLDNASSDGSLFGEVVIGLTDRFDLTLDFGDAGSKTVEVMVQASPSD